jgi:colanic acid biosynthesis glycosyl transferase WcaI
MKKVLIVCQHFWPENFRINDIAEYFVECGFQVDVLCGIPNYPKGRFFEGYGYFRNRRQQRGRVEIFRAFELPRGKSTNAGIAANYLSFPLGSLLMLPKFVFRYYDKIFLYSLSPVYMSFVGILLGKMKKIETTMYVLDLWPENLFSVFPVKNRFLRKLLSVTSHWHYKNSDKLVVLSNQMKAHMVDAVGIESERISVLMQACEKHYEVDIEDSILREKFDSRFVILYAGNISPAQSFSTMLDAASVLKTKGLSNILWVIVGDGMSASDVKSEVIARGLESSFSFEGLVPLEDVPRYTTVADVLVGCLVKSELLEATVPAKVMSYIAAGRPIALAMDGEVKELIEQRIECGFVSSTEDYIALAENIERIYNMSEEARRNMGLRARSYHFQNLERNISLRKLVDFMFL